MKPRLEIVASNNPAPAAPVEGVPEQVEMPFAVVNGEPVTELPKDLYIPPQALEVFLEAFEGPLDLLPRPKVDAEGNEEDPRAELVRRLQEYERFKRAAEDIDRLPRLERDTWSAGAELKDRKVVRLVPQVTLQEMLLVFKEVVVRAEMFSHHHVSRERLSVRERMTDVLSTLERSSFVEFVRLFRPEEGRMGVTVTFVAVLELMREGLIEIVQAEPFAPLHVRLATENRTLRLVANNDLPEAADPEAADASGEGVYEESAEAGSSEAQPAEAALTGAVPESSSAGGDTDLPPDVQTTAERSQR